GRVEGQRLRERDRRGAFERGHAAQLPAAGPECGVQERAVGERRRGAGAERLVRERLRAAPPAPPGPPPIAPAVPLPNPGGAGNEPELPTPRPPHVAHAATGPDQPRTGRGRIPPPARQSP